MSELGCGRGRGWLHLKEGRRPGLNPNTAKAESQENKKYEDLIQQFYRLNTNDENGIVSFQNIEELEKVILYSCTKEDELREAIHVLVDKCLDNEEFLEKCLLPLTAYAGNRSTYGSKKVEKQLLWKQNARKELIGLLQNNFESQENLRKTSTKKFYNSIKICTSFFRYYKELYPPGYPLIEITVLIAYLDMLLDYGNPSDMKMFASLVCENFEILSQLFTDRHQKLIELLSKLKLAITGDNKLSKSEKLLLFFSWDLIRHNYKLPPEDWEFYRNNLDDNGIVDNLRKSLGSQEKVDDHPPKIINSVLEAPQASILSATRDSESIKETSDFSQSTIEPKNSNSLNQKLVNTENAEKCSTKPVKSFDVDENKPNRKIYSYIQQDQGEKVGRPILGIGARLKKN